MNLTQINFHPQINNKKITGLYLENISKKNIQVEDIINIEIEHLKVALNELYKINNRLPFTVRLSSDFLLNDMFVYFLLNQKCKKNLFIEFSINEEIVSKKFINNVKKIKGQGYSLSLFFSEKEKTKVNLMSTLPFEQITFSSDIVKNIEEGYQHYKHLKYLNDSAISLGIKRVIFDGVNSLNQLKLTNLINNKSSSQGLIYECHSEPSVLLKESNIIQSDNFNSPEVFLEWLTYNYITSKKNQDCFNKISICSPDCKNYSNQSEVFDKLVENHYKNQNETTSFIHNIIKNSDNMFVLRNSEGVVLFENKNHENFFGRSLNGLTVQDVVSIMPDYQLCIEDDKHLLDSNEMFSVKKEIVNGELYFTIRQKIFFEKNTYIAVSVYEENKGLFVSKDSLTGCMNRDMIKNISKGSFYENKVIAFIDLNGFKKVNDAKGHDVGDSVLIGFSQILQRYTRVEQLEDVIVRYGGDEFLIFFNSRNLENINKKLIYINNVVTEHFKKQKIELCFSHGLSINHNNDIESAIKVADKAMYLAKTKFKEKYKR